MAWRVHAWDPATGTGAVVGPHLGPYGFGPAENPDGEPAFVVGDEVMVTLADTGGGYRVTSVRYPRPRTPTGPVTPALAELNARGHDDLWLEQRTTTTLRFWLGDCCAACGPSVWVRFEGVSAVHGLDDDVDLDHPWFRLATEAELTAHGLVVPAGATGYTIATELRDGRDTPLVTIVATAVEVTPAAPPRG